MHAHTNTGGCLGSVLLPLPYKILSPLYCCTLYRAKKLFVIVIVIIIIIQTRSLVAHLFVRCYFLSSSPLYLNARLRVAFLKSFLFFPSPFADDFYVSTADIRWCRVITKKSTKQREMRKQS
uniref:Uncharacterized protein n=1 Tax=Trypanosoma vivax (strain Y486) TaxID=1055687 RepID=G0TUC8_TRYVY|nr:hypothetical protein TVY486_0402280 [Trypanosoma vivax Y486]